MHRRIVAAAEIIVQRMHREGVFLVRRKGFSSGLGEKNESTEREEKSWNIRPKRAFRRCAGSFAVRTRSVCSEWFYFREIIVRNSSESGLEVFICAEFFLWRVGGFGITEPFPDNFLRNVCTFYLFHFSSLTLSFKMSSEANGVVIGKTYEWSKPHKALVWTALTEFILC